MRFMVMVKADKDSEAGVLPSEKLFAEMGKFNEELVKAGIMLAGEGLQPSSKGARVRFSGSKRTVIDGPFAETKELVAGFWMWKVKSKEEAIEWVKRCPNPMPHAIPRSRSARSSRRRTSARSSRPSCASRKSACARRVAAQQIEPRRHTCKIQPYLFFDGRCEEAAEFYRARSAPRSRCSCATRTVPKAAARHAPARLREQGDAHGLAHRRYDGAGVRRQLRPASRASRASRCRSRCPTRPRPERLFAALAEAGRCRCR